MGESATSFEIDRQERIDRNNRLLEELGLSKALIHCLPKTPTKVCSPKTPKLVLTPSRRSERIQSLPAPFYSPDMTVPSPPAEKKPRMKSLGMVPRRQEKYTMAHVAALGSFTKEWELFKDGYVNGKRVYERDIGLTCHQCRQKTLGKRTRCSQCKQRRGQVCGDCLWMRYGENVEESLANLEWTCPVCRGICNCSFCRTKNGLAPTGTMYNWAKSKGFKSVAHYLVTTFLDAYESPESEVAAGSTSSQVTNQLAKEQKDGEDHQNERNISDKHRIPRRSPRLKESNK